MRKFRCLGLTESAGDKGSPDKLRPPGAGVGKAEGARGRTGGELGTAKLAPGSPPPPAAAVRLSLVRLFLCGRGQNGLIKPAGRQCPGGGRRSLNARGA